MSDQQLEIIGFIGGALIITSLIPQLYTIIINKSSKDISIIMYFILLIAQIDWFFYGLLKNDLQVTVTNACAGILTVFIIVTALYMRSISHKLFNNPT